MKLFSKGDLKVVRLRYQGSTHYFITPHEMRTVLSVIGEAAYCLYSYYRTGFFNESDDFDDDIVGKAIGWNERKVQKYRLVLENSGYFKRDRHGSKTLGLTRVLVGAEAVALDSVGLPAEILDTKAFTKLKKQFGITDTESLIANAEAMAKEYARNPDQYK